MVSEIQGPPQGLIAGIETGKPQGNNRPKLQAVPTVDRRHVEQVRQAINDGSYVFNDRRVAENLLHFEARLPSITS
jgi:anti-sigma28 factor (negative regulator of flagellin synthesis)